VRVGVVPQQLELPGLLVIDRLDVLAAAARLNRDAQTTDQDGGNSSTVVRHSHSRGFQRVFRSRDTASPRDLQSERFGAMFERLALMAARHENSRGDELPRSVPRR